MRKRFRHFDENSVMPQVKAQPPAIRNEKLHIVLLCAAGELPGISALA
jgi:hypothetical protein